MHTNACLQVVEKNIFPKSAKTHKLFLLIIWLHCSYPTMFSGNLDGCAVFQEHTITHALESPRACKSAFQNFNKTHVETDDVHTVGFS